MTPRHLLAPARLAGSGLLATQSDERLVDLLRAGSEPAFEAIVARHRGPLLRYCAALLGRERAEDVVQQVFVNAYDAMLRDDRVLRLKPWLYRIAHNTAHNALRDRALRDETLADESPGAERPELALERQERLRTVLASVQDLPARQRDALLLRELEGRSYEEIAVALGVGGGAVRQLLNRARTTLRATAAAVTPAGLLLKLPAGGAGAGESLAARVAESTGAAGTGAVAAKVAATALVTGAVAGGVAVAPHGDSDGAPRPDPPAARAPAASGGTLVAPASSELGDSSGASSGGHSEDSGRGSRDGGDRAGEERSGPAGGHDEDRSGPSESSGPGDGDGDAGGSSSGPGSRSSGPGSGGSGSGSGSSGPGSSGSSGTGSGSSGSGSGSSGSGSGSSGSGSGSSGSESGSSGSGADPATSSGTASSS
jgi:RNA polymerase sigma factor (sigma-70 family)